MLFRSNSENTTHPVAVKDPNAFDLYDMHGNVLEWVEDCLHDDYTSAPSDGTVWVDDKCSTARVLRGGSWSATIESRALRSSGRGGDVPEIKNSAYGFRCARD